MLTCGRERGEGRWGEVRRGDGGGEDRGLPWCLPVGERESSARGGERRWGEGTGEGKTVGFLDAHLWERERGGARGGEGRGKEKLLGKCLYSSHQYIHYTWNKRGKRIPPCGTPSSDTLQHIGFNPDSIFLSIIQFISRYVVFLFIIPNSSSPLWQRFHIVPTLSNLPLLSAGDRFPPSISPDRRCRSRAPSGRTSRRRRGNRPRRARSASGTRRRHEGAPPAPRRRSRSRRRDTAQCAAGRPPGGQRRRERVNKMNTN